MRDSKTIAEARQEIQDRIDRSKEGIICPCCGQYCKLYKRKLNSGMAYSLIWLVRTYLENNRWVEIQTEAPRRVMQSREMGKLVHWGLVMSRPNKDPAKRMSGFWKPTTLGINFANDNCTMFSHVYLYNNEVRGFTKKQITIVEALGKHFNYQELMHS